MTPKLFTSLDLASGFWQLGLDEESKEKTAFVTPDGKWQYNVVPFGVKNGTSICQKNMNQAMRGLTNDCVLIYIDDLVIYSTDWKSHLKDIEQVLKRLREANLKVKPSKTNFAAPQIQFLGHKVSENGIEVNEEKIEVVKNYPVPTNAKGLRGFLGLANFYRKFVPNFAEKAKPLNKLLKKDAKYKWTTACQQAFEDLKDALTSPPVLALPDLNKDYILRTDSSKDAIGYVLSQIGEDGLERVISYGGRATKDTESRWGITELEGLAVIEGTRANRYYIANRHFDIYTDHQPLTSLFSEKDKTGKLMRWANEMQQYNYTIRYIQGKKNQVADALSRRTFAKPDVETPAEPCHAILSARTEVSPTVHQIDVHLPLMKDEHESIFKSASDFTPGCKAETNLCYIAAITSNNQFYSLAGEQKQCPEIGAMYNFHETHAVPDDKKQAAKLAADAENYFINESGILYHRHQPRLKKKVRFNPEDIIHQVVVPKCRRLALLGQYHDSMGGGGHQGVKRTYEALRLKYFWPKMYSDVEKHVTTCDECQRAKNTRTTPAPLIPLPVVGPFERWHIDYLGPLTKTKNGYAYILLMVDSFTKWVEAIPMVSTEAIPTAKAIFREVISRYGAMSSLVSDRGKSFLNNVVKELCNMFQVKHTPTSPYHPETNSTCERINSSIGSTLRAYCQEADDKWDEYLPSFLMAFRRTPSIRASDFSPYQLLFGKEMRLPIDHNYTPPTNIKKDQLEYVQDLATSLRKVNTLAENNITTTKEKTKQTYDKKAKQPTLKSGQLVLHESRKPKPGKNKKMHINYKGPYIVEDTKYPNTCKLRKAENGQLLKTRINIKNLKPYKSSEIRTYTKTVNVPHDHSDSGVVSNNDQANQREIAEQNVPQMIPPDEILEITKATGPKAARWYWVKYKDRSKGNGWQKCNTR